MTEKLDPNIDQQEERARLSKRLADHIDQLIRGTGRKMTLKGEAIEVTGGSSEIVVTANGDGTFSIKDGASHLSHDDVLNEVEAYK